MNRSPVFALAMARSAQLAVLVALHVACSNMPPSNGKGALGTSTDQATTPDTAGKSTTCSAGEAGCDQKALVAKVTKDSSDSQGSVGLTDFCTFAADKAGGGMLTCTPRDLPIFKMISKIPKDFDPRKHCTHDTTSIKCNFGAVGSVNLDFSELSNTEIFYAKFPTLMLGLKTMLSGRIEDSSPEVVDLINGSLDALAVHRKQIFTAGDSTNLFNDVQALIKKDMPGVPEAEFATMRAGYAKSFKDFAAILKSGEVSPLAFIQIAETVLQSLPPSVVGASLKKMNVAKIMSQLQENGGDAAVAQFVSVLGGQLGGLAGLGAAFKAATSTATSTATNTSTATSTAK